ncbi:MAG TPA: apolipoprotein N-acyltransferase [Cyanobacteria bacterium UBA11369]|nr:apolipoprotein N-acyltransferase [Cyanobacteria bacterium UBA11371]HBE20177.1 apolipoprotein N-acyltransferase [Cyanobacteria bacterium UBA11367]HBE32052.1 apolipoprotein N-acyltransferase [Cyanobacteria bacterium UBA11368]HBE53004.1 apolipoprotein N-acyltransferase [Cyanobacteria bacterium UBA11369]
MKKNPSKDFRLQNLDCRFKSAICNLKSKILIAFAGGILMGLTVAPASIWPLAWIALIPLWVTISDRNPIQKALAWGIGYHGVALSWVLGLHPLTWMGIPWVGSVAIALTALVLFTLWGAALVVTWAITTKALFNLTPNPLTRILIGTALWCILESIWSAGPLWWTSLSYTQSPHNLAILHLGQISGPNTITAAIVAVNGLLAEAWSDRQKQTTSPNSSSASSVPLWFVHKGYLATSVALLISLHLIGFSLYNQPLNDQPNTALKVGIIQGNIPNRIKFTPQGFRSSLTGYTNGYITLAKQKVQAILTPEGALSSIWTDPPSTNDPVYQAILNKRILAWIGAHRRRERSFTNSLFTVTGTGEIYSRYDKINLVPFGEYIPFEQLLGGIINSISAIGTSQIAGESNQLFDTPFGRAIVGICFDSAFSRHFQRQAAAGGQFILTASNNDPYSAAMQFQHHAQDTMRAIETNRWAARATNTGYSAIVDPHGRTLWISGHNTYEVHAETIYRRQTQTLYVRWGDWLTLVLLGLVAVSISLEIGNNKSKK